jgi:serine O-acetyltransferase
MSDSSPSSDAGEADWKIDAVVAQLRELRNASLAARQRIGKPPKLPSRKALASVVEGISAALFPNRLGDRPLAQESIDYFVGRTLDVTCRELFEQVLCELQFASGEEAVSPRLHEQASALVRSFAAGLPEIRRLLETDIRAAYEGDPAARTIDEVLVCYPGVTAMIHHRLAHALYRLGLTLIARMISERAHSTTGIDIHPGARIQGHFFIDHGTGVVIGETAEIGERVRLYHGVTLGAKRFAVDASGALVKGTPRHPIVEDDVVIYAGATILGRITIGRGSVIGGNVWLTQSVPPGSHVSQAKLRGEAFDEGSGI